jgi:hypothetical protein
MSKRQIQLTLGWRRRHAARLSNFVQTDATKAAQSLQPVVWSATDVPATALRCARVAIRANEWHANISPTPYGQPSRLVPFFYA